MPLERTPLILQQIILILLGVIYLQQTQGRMPRCYMPSLKHSV